MTDPTEIRKGIYDHVDAIWSRHPKELLRAPAAAGLPADLRVARIGPAPENPLDPWVYLSIGGFAHTVRRGSGVELMLLSPEKHDRHITAVCDALAAHRALPAGVCVGTTIPLLRPWRPDACCDHLLVTLPYPYGPMLEQCDARGFPVRILWLMPITASEAAFADREGVEALEDRFEARAVDFMQLQRRSVA